jgi:hypothetical protein
VIIQTMVCSINGRPPPDTEAAAWEQLALELAGTGMAAPAATVPAATLAVTAAAAVSAATLAVTATGAPAASVPAPVLPVPAAEETAGRVLPGVRGFQIYGNARPAPDDPLAEALPLAFLEARAVSLRAALAASGIRAPSGAEIPVEVFP